MPLNQKQEEPVPEPETRREDLPWRVVEGIEPEEDVLSKLAAEDDTVTPAAPSRPAPPADRGALREPVRADGPAGVSRPAVTSRSATPERAPLPPRMIGLGLTTPYERMPSVEQRAPEQPPRDAVQRIEPDAPSAGKRRFALRFLLVVVLFAGVVALIAWPMARNSWPPSFLTARADGTLVIESRPAGVPVSVDGVPQGRTPLSVSLSPGPHTVVLTGAATREVAVSVEPGARVFQYIEMPDVPALGTLHIETSTPGAEVTVDSIPRGTTPVDLADLEPGTHSVSLRLGSSSLTQEVTVRAGDVVSLVVPMTAASTSAPGWVSVSSPIELQLFEGDRLVGTSRADRVLMLAGEHDLRLVNLSLGFQTSRAVKVAPNQVTTLVVEPPRGVLNVNAVPWAEVYLDGDRIGDTPIANYPASLGSHEIVLRNPRFPERRVIVTVTLSEAARVGVDLQK